MGRDKATLIHPESGVSMLEHTVAVLAQRCAPLFVVAAAGQALPDLDRVGPVAVLRDEHPGAGPLPATGLGLRAAAAAGAQWAFVCAVDMPHLSVSVIDAVLGHRDGDAVLPWDGRDHYLAGMYRTTLAGRVDDLVSEGALRMRALADSVPTQRVLFEDRRALRNTNYAADFAAEFPEHRRPR